MAEKQQDALTSLDASSEKNLVNEYIQKAKTEATTVTVNNASQALGEIRTIGSEIVSERASLKTNLESIYKKRNVLYENLITAYTGNSFMHKITSAVSAYRKGLEVSAVIDIDRKDSELSNAITELQLQLSIMKSFTKLGLSVPVDSFQKNGDVLYQEALKIRDNLGYPDLNLTTNATKISISGLDKSPILQFSSTNFSGTIKDIEGTKGNTSITTNSSFNYRLEDGSAEYPYTINNADDYHKYVMTGSRSKNDENNIVYYNLPDNVILDFSSNTFSTDLNIRLFGTVNSGGKNIQIKAGQTQTISFSISFKPENKSNIFIDKSSIATSKPGEIDVTVAGSQSFNIIATNTLNVKTIGKLSGIKFKNFKLIESLPSSESYPEDRLDSLENIDDNKEFDEKSVSSLNPKNLGETTISILDQELITKDAGTYINLSNYLYDDRFPIFETITDDILCSSLTATDILESTELPEDLEFLILLLKTSLIRFEDEKTFTDSDIEKYRNYLTKLRTLCKSFNNTIETQSSGYINQITKAIENFDSAESTRQANDPNYNSDYTIEITSGFETISGLVETMLIEDENLDLDSIFENVETNLNSLNSNIETVICDSSEAIIKLNKYIDNYSLYFEPEENYGSAFSEMLDTASSVLVKMMNIRDFSSWKTQFTRFSFDGIFGTGQLYLAQEIGLNAGGYNIQSNEKISMAGKDLVNDSIRRAYKKNLFIAQKSVENILTYEETLSESHGLNISYTPEYELLPGLIVDEVQDLAVLNQYDISDVLSLDSNKQKYIDSTTQLIFIKYIFNGRTSNSDLEDKIRKLSVLFTKSLKNFKTVYAELQFREVVKAIDTKLSNKFKDYIEIISILKKEVEMYRMLWNLIYSNRYSNLNSLVGLLGDDELLKFLYRSDIENDFILSFPLTEETVSSALNALSAASEQVVKNSMY